MMRRIIPKIYVVLLSFSMMACQSEELDAISPIGNEYSNIIRSIQ